MNAHEMTRVATMRTIIECIDELREMDPENALTVYALRQMVRKGVVSSVRIGVKYLVNLDVLIDFLYGIAG